MKRYRGFTLLLIVLAGCATMGTEITKNNNQIQMPHYSFAVRPDQEWHLLRPDEANEVVVITNKLGPFIFQMRMMRNVIHDANLKAASAKTVADDFRNREKQIMIEQGVNKGLYQLRDLAMGEEMVGDKKIYTMNYVIFAATGTQKASLCLYFPKDENNDYFIVAHYSETVPPNAILMKSFKPEFLEAVKGLQVSQ
jgi:hypothetical protein